jgi:triosephosphate isomerase
MAVVRVKMLVGNWKMNKLNSDLEPFFSAFMKSAGLVSAADLAGRLEILFAVPATLLARAVEICKPLGIRVAAQNVHWEASGAYTGETSLPMLRELGVPAALIGHSERRQYFAESDASVASKTSACLRDGVLPIVCVGETLDERNQGKMADVITRQVHRILAAVDTMPGDLVIAYEPVWAIGTGQTATAAQAQEVHALIRSLVAAKLGIHRAACQRILYGGSANPANIAELLQQNDIDGALVGGVSLKPEEFAKMVRSAV